MPSSTNANVASGGQNPQQAKEEHEAPTFEAEEEFRKRMEPVAPWNRDNIPDYGPLEDKQHVVNFLAIGSLMTLFYEFTNYFPEIPRWLAYCTIWLPLWFLLLSRLAPKPQSEEELLKEQEERERKSFAKQLKRIVHDADDDDDDKDGSSTRKDK